MFKNIWTRIKAFFSGLFKIISDPFQDKNGDWDEKRILGVAFLVVGLLYAVGIIGKNPDSGILTIILGTGISLLGGAIVGDVNNPNTPPKSGS